MFDKYPEYEYHLAQVQLIFFMLGMGATLVADDFVQVLRRPKFLIVGAVCQFLISPLLAVAVTGWLEVEPGIAVGIILIAIMPGGTLAKLFTYLGRGNIALSITLTFVGTLASVWTVPALLPLLAGGHVRDDVSMLTVIRDELLFLVLPLCVGVLLGQRLPAWRAVIEKWCIRTGFVFVLVMITGSIGSGRIHPWEYGWTVPLAIIGYAVLAQQVSLLPFRFLGWPKPDCLSIGIEVTMRNLNLALLLKALLFPADTKGVDPIADGVLFVILFYAGVALGAGTPLALNFRRMIGREMRDQGAAKKPTGDYPWADSPAGESQ